MRGGDGVTGGYSGVSSPIARARDRWKSPQFMRSFSEESSPPPTHNPGSAVLCSEILYAEYPCPAISWQWSLLRHPEAQLEQIRPCHENGLVVLSAACRLVKDAGNERPRSANYLFLPLQALVSVSDSNAHFLWPNSAIDCRRRVPSAGLLALNASFESGDTIPQAMSPESRRPLFPGRTRRRLCSLAAAC